MTESNAVAPLPSQSTDAIPNTPNIWLRKPKSKLYISFHIAPMTMPGTRMGSRNTVRYSTRPRVMRVVISASPKPRTI